jgi:hypothetical protein
MLLQVHRLLEKPRALFGRDGAGLELGLGLGLGSGLTCSEAVMPG